MPRHPLVFFGREPPAGAGIPSTLRQQAYAVAFEPNLRKVTSRLKYHIAASRPREACFTSVKAVNRFGFWLIGTSQLVAQS